MEPNTWMCLLLADQQELIYISSAWIQDGEIESEKSMLSARIDDDDDDDEWPTS